MLGIIFAFGTAWVYLYQLNHPHLENHRASGHSEER